MKKSIEILIAFLFAVGCLAYIYGIYQACYISLQADPDLSKMPAFLSSIVTSIGAVLATNLGAVLGIAIAAPTSSFAQASWKPLAVFTSPTPTNVQITACYLYVLILVVVSIVWGIKDFDTVHVVSTIPELTKTFLGVIVGVLAITLARK